MTELVTTNQYINNKSTPIFCIIGYSKEDETFSDLKYFPIENNEFQAEIPFTNDCFNDLKDAVNVIDTNEKKSLTFESLIPENVIYFKENNIIWTIEPSCKYLYFKKGVPLSNDFYHLPKLLFALIDEVFYIFALKSNDEISEETMLYNAPFLNVYENGSVCMGNVNTAITQFSFLNNVILYLENAFFKSVFTHTNHNNIINGNIVDYFNEHKTYFDEKVLLKSKSNKQIIDLLNIIR